MAWITDIAGNGSGGAFGFGGGLSSGVVSGISGAVGDLFASEGHRLKAEGNRLEAENYDRAAGLSRKNEGYTKWSTDVKQQLADRQMYQALGHAEASIAASGLAKSGSALDLLAESRANGRLNVEMIGAQGQIQIEAYDEQAKSYDTQAQSARMAAEAEDNAATGSMITGALKGIGALAMLA